MRELRGWPSERVEGVEFDRPALFMRGAKSDYVSDKDFEEARETYFPAATLETVPAAGHWLHAEQPDIVYKLVADFVDQRTI